MQIDQQQALEQDLGMERAALEPRSARVLSIEELRQKLGLPLAHERHKDQTMISIERPRIVRRRQAETMLAVG